MPGAVSFPYCPERKLNTVSLPAEYGLHMLLFSSDLKPVIIELNSGIPIFPRTFPHPSAEHLGIIAGPAESCAEGDLRNGQICVEQEIQAFI